MSLVLCVLDASGSSAFLFFVKKKKHRCAEEKLTTATTLREFNTRECVLRDDRFLVSGALKFAVARDS